MSTFDQLPDAMPADRDGYELWVVERAIEFSTVRFLGRGKKDRRDFKSLDAAIADATPDQRAMVYAATGSGRSTMIGRQHWTKALKVVGTKA